jgi:hypothetical protein
MNQRNMGLHRVRRTRVPTILYIKATCVSVCLWRQNQGRAGAGAGQGRAGQGRAGQGGQLKVSKKN